MKRQYSTFEEIDADLKVMKMKKDINWICVKSDYQRLLRNLSIKHLFSDAVVEIKDSFVSKKNSLLSMGVEYLIRKVLD